MHRFIDGEDRMQRALLPHSLEDYVGEENPVRVIEVFIDELDLAALGFSGMTPAATGRPAYHPSTLLKIYLYGYLNRLQSSRRLEREAQRNVELMWLTGRLAPDFNRHSPDSGPVGGDCPSLEVPRQRNSIAANPGGSQIGGSPASQGRNSLLCLHQGAPLPSLYVASDPIFLVMPALAAPAAGRSATGFPGTSAAAPRLRPSETSRSDRG